MGSRNMRALRIANGWTQKYVGDMVGLTPEAVLLIETGQRDPSYKISKKLIALFGEEHKNLLDPISHAQPSASANSK